MAKRHGYAVEVRWTGNRGEGTCSYGGYSRAHEIAVPGKTVIAGSADPEFRGDAACWNPEELLVASLAGCHQLWYLHLCAVTGVVVESYTDRAVGVLLEEPDGLGEFTEVTLRPHVRLAAGMDEQKARHLHEEAARMCFIARSVSFAVRHEPSFEVGR